MNKHLLFLALLAPALQATAQQLPMRLWYDRPAQYFEEAMPIGNGRLGAMVYGGAEEGVKLYIEKIGAELSDTMAMCGAENLASINRDMVLVK